MRAMATARFDIGNAILSLMVLRFLALCLCCAALPACTTARPAATQPVIVQPLDRLVIYEVNPRAFSQTGDLKGVTARLAELQALGVNTIWLMPIHPVGRVKSVGAMGSPYAIRDYCAVGEEYGSIDDLTALVAAAHARGMAVMLDWVANHTAWDHPWLAADADWYTRDPAGNVVIPPGTNWQDVAELNYQNPAMRRAMIDAMLFWIERAEIDGYRCDAADMVPVDFWREAIAELRASGRRPLVFLAEGTDRALIPAGFDLLYSWDVYAQLKEVVGKGGSAKAFGAAIRKQTSEAPAGARFLHFTTNHDQSAWEDSPIPIFGGDDAAVAAFALATFSGGTPLVYTGQEVGTREKTPFFDRSPIDWSDPRNMSPRHALILRLRQEHSALHAGDMTVDFSSDDVVGFARRATREQAVVLVNVRNHTSPIDIPPALRGRWFNPRDRSSATLPATATLDPYEWRVFTRPLRD